LTKFNLRLFLLGFNQKSAVSQSKLQSTPTCSDPANWDVIFLLEIVTLSNFQNHMWILARNHRISQELQRLNIVIAIITNTLDQRQRFQNAIHQNHRTFHHRNHFSPNTLHSKAPFMPGERETVNIKHAVNQLEVIGNRIESLHDTLTY
jgi:hypothetical protein